LNEVVRRTKEKLENDPTRVINPVVFIPGFLASALDCSKSDGNSPNFCPDNRPGAPFNYQCWLSVPKIVRLRCFMNEMSRNYENGNYSLKNDGLTIEGKDFGGVDGVETITKYLDVPLMRGMIEAFEAVGYARDISFRAATYDWTFASYHYETIGYYTDLRLLIEETYRMNGNRRVNLIGHSMGTLQGHYFLTKMVTQEWKDTYLVNMVDITPLYRGAPLAIRAILTGLTPIPLVKFYLRTLVENWGSVHWFLPFNWPNQVFVYTKDGDSHYESDLERLFIDAGYPNVADAYPRAHNQTAMMGRHNVTYHCFTASGIETNVGADYRDTRSYAQTPINLYEDGDSLVPAYSSSACEQLGPVTRIDYGGAVANHVSLLNYPPFLETLLDITTASAI